MDRDMWPGYAAEIAAKKEARPRDRAVTTESEGSGYRFNRL